MRDTSGRVTTLPDDDGGPAALHDEAGDRSELTCEVAEACRRARSARSGPLVAIVVATHRPRRPGLERLIDSIRAQDHADWVCVLADNGSGRAELDAIRELIGDDPRFVVSGVPASLPASANLERALASIEGSAGLIALADQADSWHPSKLSRLIGALGDRATLAYSDMRVVDSDQRPLSESVFAGGPLQPPTIDSLAAESLVPGSAAVFRRKVLDLALPFPRGEGGASGDGVAIRSDQWLALAARTAGELVFEPAPLTTRLATEPDHSRDLVSLAVRSWTQFDHKSPHVKALIRARLAPAPAPALPANGNGSGRTGPAERPAAPVRERRVEDRTAAGERDAVAGGRSLSIDPETAILVERVSKTFSVPAAEPETLARRLRRPLRHMNRESLTALEGISFEVRRGEFFGIVGGNGSGKTTMLQLLANVYRADSGRILIAPRVAPIISLGIGFQQDLPALPNVLQTAQLLGLSAAEARRRFDDVLEFAGLEDFEGLKLRNYSSGMRVRLAFGVVLLVDAEVLLFDEVFAVGDAGFKEKAGKAFERLRKDKTVVLVTHNMSHLQTYCDRAMLLHRGRMVMIGEPSDVGRRYAELALEEHGQDTDLPPGAATTKAEPRAEISDLWLSNRDGDRVTSVDAGEEIVLHATVDATAPIGAPGFRFEIRRRGAARIFAPPTLSLRNERREGRRGPQGVRAGGRLQVETAIENKLAPGPYTIVCAVTATRNSGEVAVSAARTLDFAIASGPTETRGVVDLEHTVRVRGRRRGRGRNRTDEGKP